MAVEDKKLVMLFVRWPEVGQVKTRLARALGDEQAARLYQVMVEFSIRRLRRLTEREDWQVLLYATPVEKLRHVAIWLNDGTEPILDAMPQKEGSLAERLEHAMEWGFGKLKAREVYLVGSDCPLLEAQHLLKASELMEENDAVMGRALDGGFYMIGMKKPLPGIFHGVSYSEADTSENLLRCFEEHEIPIDSTTLPVLSDIDVEEDLRRMPVKILEAFLEIAQARGIDLQVLESQQ